MINNLYNRTSVEGEKTWDDADDQDGIRPQKIIVQMLLNGKILQSKTVLAD